MTRVRVLTPPGTGAIATVEVSGPRAWELARELFQPAGKPLPTEPPLHRFWFGKLAGDEVILAVTGPETIEVHCHGGVRVVRWVVERFAARGCVEARRIEDSTPATLLQRAPTLRTAAILLDQFHGAFDREVRRIRELLESHVGQSPTYDRHVGQSPTYDRHVGQSPTNDRALEALRELSRWAPVGRHLVEPWKVVVAGAPNVGKSSLVNALAGFQRAVVSDVAGTTRDVVSMRVAFDGWPVELTDTAGLRESEGLEAEGVERARKAIWNADLVLWVMDAGDIAGGWPRPGECPMDDAILVTNKIDRVPARDPVEFHGKHRGVAVSATAGTGLPELIAEIVKRFVPDPPPDGAPVPYTPRLAELVLCALKALEGGRVEEARRMVRECLERQG